MPGRTCKLLHHREGNFVPAVPFTLPERHLAPSSILPSYRATPRPFPLFPSLLFFSFDSARSGVDA